MKKKALLILVLALLTVFTLAISVSAEETDPYASYYDKVYTAIDGTPLALYEWDGENYYPLAWFYNGDSAVYESFRVDTEVQFCIEGKTTPIGANTDFNQKTNLIFTDETKTYTMANMILINLHGSKINSFSGSWTGLPIEAIYCNTDLRYVNGDTFKNNATLSVFDIPKAHNRTNGTICGSFQNCLRLKEIYIPKSMCLLSSAFAGSGLERVEFAAEYEPVGAISWQTSANKESWFNGCKSLKTVIFPKSSLTHTYIGGYVFQGCTALEEFTIPSYITSINKCAFKNCTALKVLHTDNVDGVEYAIVLGDGITTIGEEVFRGVDAIKYIKLPSTLTSLGIQALRDNDSLQYIDYNNCGITTIGKFEFYDNKALVTVSLPEGLITLNADRVFNNCSKMEVLYLPEGLTSICSFKNMGKLYFTDKPYHLTWTDGMFDSEDWNGQKPEKPTVYYFPEGIGNFDEAFNSCHALNDIVVFQEGVTAITNKNTFYNLDNKTFVFLGEVSSFNQESNKKSNFYFINDSVTEETLTATGNGKHNLFFHSAGSHICEKTVSVDATCVDNKKLSSICFCGNEFSAQEEDGTALGHNHINFVDLVYVTYLAEGDYNYKCERCEDVASKAKAPSLFKLLGTSAAKYGNGGIVIGFVVNADAISQYKEITGKSVEFGVFVGLKTTVSTDSIFNEDGKAKDGVVSVDMTNRQFDVFELKVTGFTTDEQKNTQLVMGAYVKVMENGETEYSYLQEKAPENGETYYSASYNDIMRGVIQ